MKKLLNSVTWVLDQMTVVSELVEENDFVWVQTAYYTYGEVS